MAEKIKIKPEWDNITKISTEALNAGTTYGKLQGQRYGALQDKLAEQERRMRENRKRRETPKEEQTQEPQEPERLCPYCGKPVAGMKTYCNKTCRYMFNQDKAIQNAKESYERLRGQERKKQNLYCLRCGKPIEASRRNKYCGPVCAKAAHIEQHHKRYEQMKQRMIEEEKNGRAETFTDGEE